jgi:hypothetical protein
MAITARIASECRSPKFWAARVEITLRAIGPLRSRSNTASLISWPTTCQSEGRAIENKPFGSVTGWRVDWARAEGTDVTSSMTAHPRLNHRFSPIPY